MKRRIKVVFALVAAAATLASCGHGYTRTWVTGGNDGEAVGDVEAGYTKLAKKESFGEVDSDGNFTIADQKIPVKDTYKTTYSTEPDDFDYLKTAWQYNSLIYGQMVDGLISNDAHGNIYGGLADSYKTVKNADGSETWTFHLRDGINWYRNDTKEVYAPVKAEDFVTGMKHILDPKTASDLSYLPTGVIKNAALYLKLASDDNKTNDMSFDEVGIKAPDDKHVEYTLFEPTPYFLTCLTYGAYYPLNAKFLDEMGSDYGKGANKILVNGAFFLTKQSKESKIEMERNPNYYNSKHVYIKDLIFQYVGASAGIEQARKLYEAGDIDGFNVQSADEQGYDAYVKGKDGKGTSTNPADPNCSAVISHDQFSFVSYFNYLRTSYVYPNGAAVTKNEAQKKATALAIQNVDFRKGFLYGLNVMKYLPFYNKGDPVMRLNRVYTVRGLVSDSKGKDYSDYVVDEYNNANNSKVKLVGTEISTDAGSGKGTDPIYSKEKAKSYFDKAKAALIAAGVIKDGDIVYVDVLGEMDAVAASYQKEMYDSIEDVSGGWVKCNILTPSSDKQNTQWGSKINNYDFSMFMGWGADYGDPKSFLHTLVGESFDETGKLTDIGDTLNYLGFNGITDVSKGGDGYKEALDRAGVKSERELSEKLFTKFNGLYNDALKYNTTDTYDKRLAAFAKAEYNLIYEDALIIPWYTRSGLYDTVTRVIPHTSARAFYGLNPDKYTNTIISNDPITKEQREAINKWFESSK